MQSFARLVLLFLSELVIKEEYVLMIWFEEVLEIQDSMTIQRFPSIRLSIQTI